MTRHTDNGKFWLLLLAVTYDTSVLTFHFEDDTKGITNDTQMYLRQEVHTMEKYWLLLWAIYESPSITTCHF